MNMAVVAGTTWTDPCPRPPTVCGATGHPHGGHQQDDLPPKNWSKLNVSLGPQKGGQDGQEKTCQAGEVASRGRHGSARRIGVTQQTFYRWRTEYGGLRIDQARRKIPTRGLKRLSTNIRRRTAA